MIPKKFLPEKLGLKIVLFQKYFLDQKDILHNKYFRLNKIWGSKKCLVIKKNVDSNFFKMLDKKYRHKIFKFWMKKYRHQISLSLKQFMSRKIGVQKISFVPQEKFWGPERLGQI